MTIGPELKKKLSKTYEPSSLINMEFKGNDLAFKTDTDGNPVLLFIGKRTESGNIRGERYSRTLKRDAGGAIIKDHWDLKGKAS
jgi:hypothetical protein